MRFLALLLAGSLVSGSAARASGELTELYRSTRAAAMGGAYLGLSDDESAVFLNPAGLAGNKKFSLHLLPIDVAGAPADLGAIMEVMGAFGDFSIGSINALMGKNAYARLQASPTLITPNFGVSILVDQQVALYAQNRALPRIILGYQTTNGIQAAYGFSVGRMSRKAGAELRFGVGAKILWRRGGYNRLSNYDLLSLDPSILPRLMGTFGTGYGLDLGTQYVRQVGQNLTLSGSLAYTDIGDTSFGGGQAPVKGNLAGGIAASYEIRRARVSVLYDYRHMLAGVDWRRKSHLGLEIAMPVLSLYAGVNQVTPTYGFGLDFWLLKIAAAATTEELGSFAFQDPQPRWVLRVDLKFDL